ncbi:DUF3592 domain-containing protein [Thiolapillus sp.]
MGFLRFVFPIALLFIGAALLAQGFKHWSISRELVNSSLVAEGTVIRNAPYMSSKAGKTSALVYFPQVKFTTKDGTEVEFVSKVTSRAEQYQPGDAVRVLYKENQPDDAVIGSFQALWAIAIIFAGSGLMVVLFASWFYRKALRGWEKEDGEEQGGAA